MLTDEMYKYHLEEIKRKEKRDRQMAYELYESNIKVIKEITENILQGILND